MLSIVFCIQFCYHRGFGFRDLRENYLSEADCEHSTINLRQNVNSPWSQILHNAFLKLSYQQFKSARYFERIKICIIFRVRKKKWNFCQIKKIETWRIYILSQDSNDMSSFLQLRVVAEISPVRGTQVDCKMNNQNRIPNATTPKCVWDGLVIWVAGRR